MSLDANIEIPDSQHGTSLKVAYMNARSITAHIDSIRFLIINYKYDIVLVSETWINSNTPKDLYSINDYTFFHVDREQGRGGGVGAYIKNNLAATIINIDVDPSLNEQLWLRVRVAGKLTAVGVIYRPPSVSYKHLETLFPTLEHLYLNYEHIIIGGDFNINYLNAGDPEQQFVSTLFQSINLFQVVTEPTRVTNLTSSLLDYIIVSKANLVGHIRNRPICFSDHNILEFNYLISTPKFVPKIITRRCFKKFNIASFSTDVSNTNWEQVYMSNDINIKISNFNNTVTNLFNKHAPFKSFKITRPFAPWLNDSILAEFAVRDKLLDKCHKIRQKKQTHLPSFNILENQ